MSGVPFYFPLRTPRGVALVPHNFIVVLVAEGDELPLWDERAVQLAALAAKEHDSETCEICRAVFLESENVLSADRDWVVIASDGITSGLTRREAEGRAKRSGGYATTAAAVLANG